MLVAAEKRLEELDARVSRPGYEANVPAAVKEKDAAERQKQRATIAELRSNGRVLAQANDAQE